MFSFQSVESALFRMRIAQVILVIAIYTYLVGHDSEGQEEDHRVERQIGC